MACGDGLNPGVTDRAKKLEDNKQKVCKDAKGADQVPKCGDNDQERDGETGEWKTCPKDGDKDVTPSCGDGLNAGTDRADVNKENP